MMKCSWPILSFVFPLLLAMAQPAFAQERDDAARKYFLAIGTKKQIEFERTLGSLRQYQEYIRFFLANEPAPSLTFLSATIGVEPLKRDIEIAQW